MSTEELRLLIESAQNELKRKEQRPSRITFPFEKYNNRKFSKPWIAKVTQWETGSNPSYLFGKFLGVHGQAGICEISARIGDVICWGQKNYNSFRRSVRKIGVVTADYSIKELTDSEAKRVFDGGIW